ncbi:MAG TPA: hypothetical protein PKW37_10095 [Salinivirgaceae bacterium]|nr:hypothetical protein [Salinivirgaceae bacterium]
MIGISANWNEKHIQTCQWSDFKTAKIDGLKSWKQLKLSKNS